VNLFDRMTGGGHEQVVFGRDRPSGLRAIVAVHSTRLGPALGGTRFHPYPTEEAALDDVLRLARAMTYKAAVAGLALGGGKAVIIGDPARDRTPALIEAYGGVVDSLGGRYLTAEDVGTTQDDMDVVRQVTPFVTGTSRQLGGSGDPSPATASGLVAAMRAVANHLWNEPSLRARHVTIAGVGKVGSAVVRHLVGEGAKVTVADVDAAALARVTELHGVGVAAPDAIHRVPCDIHAPCALGGSLNRATIPELDCAAVVGCANNQLADASCVDLLADAAILWAPDYVVNAGGLVNLAAELGPGGYDEARAAAAVDRIFDTTTAVLATAVAEGITTAEAADGMAERRLSATDGRREPALASPAGEGQPAPDADHRPRASVRAAG
jgi:valine dehydrogenase (NAD+)